MSTSKRITVLMGGISSERTVSLSSGQGVAEALRSLGHTVSTLDAGADLAHWLPNWAYKNPMSCLTHSMADLARTAVFRAFWTGWALPIHILACGHPPQP